jgi:hypothetical protein
MSVTKDHLNRLIEALANAELPAAERILEELRATRSDSLGAARTHLPTLSSAMPSKLHAWDAC